MKQYGDQSIKINTALDNWFLNIHVYFCLFLLDSGEFSTPRQGNVIRLYALQAVSAKAMRKVINNPPNAFQKNIKDVKKLCKSKKNCDKTWAKEFLSSNYVFFYLNRYINSYLFIHEK